MGLEFPLHPSPKGIESFHTRLRGGWRLLSPVVWGLTRTGGPGAIGMQFQNLVVKKYHKNS